MDENLSFSSIVGNRVVVISLTMVLVVLVMGLAFTVYGMGKEITSLQNTLQWFEMDSEIDKNALEMCDKSINVMKKALGPEKVGEALEPIIENRYMETDDMFVLDDKDTGSTIIKRYDITDTQSDTRTVEAWIEKKALQGVFEKPCLRHAVGLAPCKGYSSLTFLNEATYRFQDAIDRGQEVVILYFGDYDPSGEDIPRSIQKNLDRMGHDLTVKRIALNPQLIKEYSLPGVPPKSTDTRTRNWDGDSAVELDAIEPRILQNICNNAIKEQFDDDLHGKLLMEEEKEQVEYQRDLKNFVKEL